MDSFLKRSGASKRCFDRKNCQMQTCSVFFGNPAKNLHRTLCFTTLSPNKLQKNTGTVQNRKKKSVAYSGGSTFKSFSLFRAPNKRNYPRISSISPNKRENHQISPNKQQDPLTNWLKRSGMKLTHLSRMYFWNRCLKISLLNNHLWTRF